jgi:hypothetical protein
MQQTNGMFKNYVDQSNDFDDAASSALMAAAVYRLSLLTGVSTFVPNAEIARKALLAGNGTSATLSPHFTADGWLSPVVDPENYRSEGSKSPDGEAFVLSMHAAFHDWIAAGDNVIL